MSIDFQEKLQDMEAERLKTDLDVLLWEMEVMTNQIKEINEKLYYQYRGRCENAIEMFG